MMKIIKKTTRFLLIFVMIASWFFSYPPDFYKDLAEQNKSFLIPQEVPEALAAQVTIDNTVAITAVHQRSTSQIVCISDTVCYSFYIDATNADDVFWNKSTNSGTSWAAASGVAAAGTFIGVGAWYDRWTPGDTTGTYIHLVFFEIGTDRLWYSRFNTATDTASTARDVSGGAEGSITTANDLNIAKGTNGDLYVVTCDITAPTAPANFVESCPSASDCTLAASWTGGTQTPNPWDNVGDDTNDNHEVLLLPMASGNMMLVHRDIATDDIEYKIYTDATNTWVTDFTDIDISAADSITYPGSISGTVDLATNDLYISYVVNPGTANTSEIRAWKYSSSTWSQLTDPWPDTTDAASFIFDVSIGIDSNSADLYVSYARAPSVVGTRSVYSAVSYNGGSTWTADTILSSTTSDFQGVSINASSNERMYAMWSAPTPDDDFGNTVADISALDFTWITGAVNFKIYQSASLTWGAGTLACEGTLTDTNANTISCTSGTDISPSTQYRVDALLKNNGGTTAKMRTASDYVDHVNVKAGWAGSTGTTLGTCGFYDAGSDNGTTTCSAAWDTTNNVRITNTHASGNVNIKVGATEGFMYLITTGSDSATSSTSYMNTSIDSNAEDSSKITITKLSGTLSVLIVDSGGAEVISPNVNMSSKNLDFACQTSTGTFGIDSQRIRVNNGTGNSLWTLSAAASVTTALWSAGSPNFDFNDNGSSGCADSVVDADLYGGQMTQNASVATSTPQVGCTNTGITLGGSTSFVEGTTNSATLLIAGATAGTSCYWDLTGVAVSQMIPAEQAVGSYTITMTVDVVAN